MGAFVVGRPINGISLNGLEYLLYSADNPLGKPEGMVIVYHSIESAKQTLLENGITEQLIEEIGIQILPVKKVFCPTCQKEIVLKQKPDGEFIADCECGYHEDPLNWYSAVPALGGADESC